jgi:hypothetical protein
MADADLTTEFVLYLEALRDADVVSVNQDTTTKVAKDVPTMRSGNVNLDDANTAYLDYLT